MVDAEVSTEYILDAGTVERGALGGKAASLAALAGEGLPIPAWFVVSAAALEASLSAGQRAALAGAMTSEQAQAALAGVSLAPEVAAAVGAALARLGARAGETYAVRSSAREEDGAAHSFAGQLESYLETPADAVGARIVDVWRSGYSARIYAYRRERGLEGAPEPPAVLVQRMVQAEKAGVAFSADPVSGRRSVAVVAAVTGLGEGLVAGEREADTYRVWRDGEIVERRQVEPGKPVLSDDEARAVAALARRAERFFGRAQDTEWALTGGQLYLLQSRPVTALAGLADPEGAYTLWDNSNIIESYGGMTTPLTYSFARRAYAEVYQVFCRILKVPEGTIANNQAVFANLIGLIRGRIYYNLLNWYRILAMLPGFKANRGFMEQMMGVKEALPVEIATGLDQASWQQKMADRLYLARTVLGLIGAYFGLEGRKAAFYARLDQALGEGRPDLSAKRADELVAYYRQLDSQLLHQWDAPLVNDFFAMIFYGVLRRLGEKWCGDQEGTLQNDLLAGEGGMISAEPAGRVRELARLARQAERVSPGFVACLQEGSRQEIEAGMGRAPEFAAAYQAYLEKFGDRCLNELKLESLTLFDDPLPLLRAVGQLAAYGSDEDGAAGGREQAIRQAAEARVAAAGLNWWRRRVFGWVLRNARSRVRDRENLRFERTRVFGRARLILGELGRRFYAEDKLDAPRDVYWLNLDEVLGFVEGTTTSADLRGLAGVRKAEYAGYRAMPAPAARFATYGMVQQGNLFEAARESVAPGPEGDVLRGIGCCPGVVRGRARVVADPLTARLEPGDIVVAEHTDPSWILILPLAAGLLVARGSLLSHAAIVSRELGIPAVVSLAGIMEWLKDGDEVELDGSSGVVRRLGIRE